MDLCQEFCTSPITHFQLQDEPGWDELQSGDLVVTRNHSQRDFQYAR